MPTVVLHQWERSPFCSKVRKVLRHKGIEFSVVDYNGLLARSAAKLSAAGQLPVLDFDDERVQDSSAIVTFLESRVPEAPVVPVDPGERALAAVIEDWADEALSCYAMAALSMGDPGALKAQVSALCEGRPAWERIPVGIAIRHHYRRKLAVQGLGRRGLPDIMVTLHGHLGALDTLLARRAWLVGEAKSVADIAVSCQLDLAMNAAPVARRMVEYPHLSAWLARCA